MFVKCKNTNKHLNIVWCLHDVWQESKELFKSDITGVRDQCEKPQQELCAVEEPCLKSLESFKKGNEEHVSGRSLKAASPRSATEHSFIVLLKKRKYWPRRQLIITALHQSLANCTKTVTEKKDVI